MFTCLIMTWLVFSATATPQAAQDRQITVGRVIIVGNTKTSDAVIRKAVQIAPGDRISFTMLREADKRLIRLGIFEVNPQLGIQPTVTVLAPNDGETTNDILIRVKEATPK